MKPAAFTCCGLHTLRPHRFSAYAIITATGTPSPRPWARNAIGGTISTSASCGRSGSGSPSATASKLFSSRETTRTFPTFSLGELFAQLQRRMPHGDVLFLLTARKHLVFATTLVTWDRHHFRERFAGRVATPEEVLA